MTRKLKNGNEPGSNELIGTISRVVRLLEYLRANTDKDNPISQSKLLEAGGKDHSFGARATIRKYIEVLAEVLNQDEFGGRKPKDERRLSYKAFDEHYDDDDALPAEIRDIYYNQVFSDDEITKIINALCTSKAVSKADAELIAEKLRKNLAKNSYIKPAYELDFSEYTDRAPGIDPAQLSENIEVIQQAISGGLRVSFDYNRLYSNKKGELYCRGESVEHVTPHFIVCENGRLVMYGGFDSGKLCVHRVDMMTNICLAGKGKSTSPSLDKLKLGLPADMDMTDEFKIRHLCCSYNNDYSTVKFKWSCRNEETGEFICTALYGAFGNRFRIDGSGEVTVQTSKFGMKIFALQYADYVEVTAPESLVKDIAGSVRGLRDKYL